MHLDIKTREYPLADYRKDGIFYELPGWKKRVPMIHETLRVHYKMSDEQFYELMQDISGYAPQLELLVSVALETGDAGGQLHSHKDTPNKLSAYYVDTKQVLHLYTLTSDDTVFFKWDGDNCVCFRDKLELLLDQLRDSDDLALRRALKAALLEFSERLDGGCPELAEYTRAALG